MYYRIIDKDADHSFIRLQSRTLSAPESENSVNFEIQASSWQIEVYVSVPKSVTLVESEVRQLNSERKNLAWSISTRARLLAGESRGPRIKSGVR
jgi:hypothetical protein